MNRLRLKFKGKKVGEVQTILPPEKTSREITSLTGDEIAQLIVDLLSLPQVKNDSPLSEGKPSLRPGEDTNLLRILFITANHRYGGMFNTVIAKTFAESLPS
jgi:hypothetical protein